MSSTTANYWQKRKSHKFFGVPCSARSLRIVFKVIVANTKLIVVRNVVLSFVLLSVMVLNFHCLKNSICAPILPANEAATIQAFAAANGINAIAHSSGLYYEIIDPGYGATATLSSKIVITYTGMLLDGMIFDHRSTPNNTQSTGSDSPWKLSALVEGWKIGIPLIQEGGHIKLIIPSAMGYGCAPYKEIPGNSILFFDINLVDVQ